MMLRDLRRLDPAWVQLWNGEKWTQLLGMSKTPRNGTEMEIVLRSGERISCTQTHQWPTQRGLLRASELKVGDILKSCVLPEPESPLDSEHIDEDAAWLSGLYLAEGSRSNNSLRIHGHAKETERWKRVATIARKYGGSATVKVHGNNMTISIYGKMIHALVEIFVSGKTCYDKAFASPVWRYSNTFLRAFMNGYLSGDGHWDAANNRWRLGFCRNYSLERDLRTACARLGWSLTLSISTSRFQGGSVPSFRGEIREAASPHYNCKKRGEVIAIRKARCREVYDLGVADEPHLFSLASGILTHNCKKAPMPESVTDRPTSATEKIFLFTKSAKYFYDADAVRNPPSESFANDSRWKKGSTPENEKAGYAESGAQNPKAIHRMFDKQRGHSRRHAGFNDRWDAMEKQQQQANGSNMRNFWLLSPEPYSESHFATFPTIIPRKCILAGTSAKGCCVDCGAPFERLTETERSFESGSGKSGNEPVGKNGKHLQGGGETKDIRRGPVTSTTTTGWQATCKCESASHGACQPCTVLDPFGGSGTTGQVALELGRRAILIELNPEYVKLIEQRCHVTPGLPLA